MNSSDDPGLEEVEQEARPAVEQEVQQEVQQEVPHEVQQQVPQEVPNRRPKKAIASDTLTRLVREAEGIGISRKKKRNNRNILVRHSSEPPQSADETTVKDRPSSSLQSHVSEFLLCKNNTRI